MTATTLTLCPHCGKRCRGVEGAQQHIRDQHPPDSVAQWRDRPTCPGWWIKEPGDSAMIGSDRIADIASEPGVSWFGPIPPCPEASE